MIAAEAASGFLRNFFFVHAVFNTFKIMFSFTCFPFRQLYTTARCVVSVIWQRDLYITGDFVMIA
jgi:hypothetical protein